MYFQYDTSGTPLGFVLNGIQYFYITNQMGDILAITDTDGNVIGNYEYDAWGKVLTADTDIAKQNPLRYRGYYYDNETGYYYLQSRYYDSNICRFINADIAEILSLTKNLINGINLYVYCSNGAINSSDKTGHLSKLDASILLIEFIVAYLQPKYFGKKYSFSTRGLFYEGRGTRYISRINYYKGKSYKGYFTIVISDYNGWSAATKASTNLNMDYVNSSANYIIKEQCKGASTSLTNSGPDVTGITAASVTLGTYVAIINIRTGNYKKIFKWAYGSNGKSNKDYYLYHISRGFRRINGWYLVGNGKVKKR